MTIRLALLATAALAALPTPASAAVLIFTGTLSGSQEVPPVSTPGSGVASVSFDTVTNLLTVQALFGNLLGNTTMAHIHCCAPVGVNAGVATPLPSFPGFPLGVTSGSYSSSFDLTQASSFSAGFITANGGTVTSARTAFINGLSAGRTYFNIHTSQFPGGEIRAQLQAVPEPGSWALMLAGFSVVGAALRRNRRAKARLATAV